LTQDTTKPSPDTTQLCPVGGVAQWLGRRFLAGGLFLFYA